MKFILNAFLHFSVLVWYMFDVTHLTVIQNSWGSEGFYNHDSWLVFLSGMSL